MKQRTFERTGRSVSVIGLGTWQLGADWGTVEDNDALTILGTAEESGVDFFDTADVYGDGRSERLICRYLRDTPRDQADGILVATKLGRRGPQVPEAFTLDNFRTWIDRSRSNLGTDRLALVQLHCPPTPVFAAQSVYDDLDTLVAEERIAAYGVSVETCDEAMMAMERPNVATVQIILNIFRRKPLERVLPAAMAAGIGVIARVPLASGLLSGRFGPDTVFAANDHRNYNRRGGSFDVGETFSGVEYGTGLEAVHELAEIVPAEMTLAQMALRWVIQQPGVTSVIPGATSATQAETNSAVADLPPLPDATLSALEDVYDRLIRAEVHARW